MYITYKWQECAIYLLGCDFFGRYWSNFHPTNFRYSHSLTNLLSHHPPILSLFSTSYPMARRLSIAFLLAAVLLCLNPVNSQVALLLRGKTEETNVEAKASETSLNFAKPETDVVASEPEDVPVSLTGWHGSRSQ
jgi:hypothetical protein